VAAAFEIHAGAPEVASQSLRPGVRIQHGRLGVARAPGWEEVVPEWSRRTAAARLQVAAVGARSARCLERAVLAPELDLVPGVHGDRHGAAGVLGFQLVGDPDRGIPGLARLAADGHGARSLAEVGPAEPDGLGAPEAAARAEEQDEVVGPAPAAGGREHPREFLTRIRAHLAHAGPALELLVAEDLPEQAHLASEGVRAREERLIGQWVLIVCRTPKDGRHGVDLAFEGG